MHDLLLIVVPFHHGQVLEHVRLQQLRVLAIEPLLLLLEAALVDLVLTELFEIVGQAQLLPQPDGPLGGIELMPGDPVPVVRGELVVEVVVPFAQRDESRERVIPGGVAVVERLVSEPVGDGVDAEGRLLDEEGSEDAGVDETALPVTPEATDAAGEDVGHEHGNLHIMVVLPDDNGVVGQVGDVGRTPKLRIWLEDQPSDVGVE